MGFFRRLFGGLSDRTPPRSRTRGVVSSGGRAKRIRPRGRGPSLSRQAVYDPLKLNAAGIAEAQTCDDLAAAMGIACQRLKWLAASGPFHRQHYIRRVIPKRSGGERTLLAPKAELKAAQKWILDRILGRVAVNDCAHGFTCKRSILTNARPHSGHAIVLSADLVNFFPSISRASVRGVFAWMGYSAEVADILSLLCTASCAGSRRCLPQGAPTSPALSNLVCWRLDRRLEGLAHKFEATYTRYADDITFSGDRELKCGMKRFLPLLTAILGEEGFVINRKKVRFMRKGSRQEVTGLVINDKPGRPREEVRRLRAILHNCRVNGVAAENRCADPAFLDRIAGRIGIIAMCNAAQGEKLLAEFKALREARGQA